MKSLGSRFTRVCSAAVLLLALGCTAEEPYQEGSVLYTGAAQLPGSCKDACGGKSRPPGSCWCDDACIQLEGNCCTDKTVVCDGGARWQNTRLVHMTEHAALLPTGKVMLWGLWGDTRPGLWDPVANTLTRIPFPTGSILHNSGHTALPDGRLLMVGGGFLLTTARTFDPTAPAGRTPWGLLGGGLSAPRFYPSVVLLGSGGVLVSSGDYLTGPSGSPSLGWPVEIYDPKQDRWVPIVVTSDGNRPLPSSDLYPKIFLLPSGRLVYIPVAEDFSERIRAPAILALDGPRVKIPSGGGEIEALSTTKGWEPLPVTLQRRKSGGAVLLIDDTQPTPSARILAVGNDGGTSELIDFTDELRPTASKSRLGFARGDHPGVVALPTGDVLVFDGHLSRSQPPEVFHAGTWERAGPAPKFARAYHSAAVLLPDGRVLVSSDGLNASGSRDMTETMEVFSPTYLAQPRPAITGSPASAKPRDVISITPSISVSSVAAVSLLRTASVTHGTDPGQRYIKLKMSRVGSTLRVTMPATNSAPAGPYLLHIVDDKGVPSAGRFIQMLPL